jgi:hypothetical protein
MPTYFNTWQGKQNYQVTYLPHTNFCNFYTLKGLLF